MFISVFDIFKIGIGPSSSHTMGPMSAARRFLDEIATGAWPRPADVEIDSLRVTLHGSLAFTGVGHGTDRAVILGLAGFKPDDVDPAEAARSIEQVRATNVVHPAGHKPYRFRPAVDLVFDREVRLPGHTNGMVFLALGKAGQVLLRRVYYSVGGGFVLDDEEMSRPRATPAQSNVPYPFANAVQMLAMAKRSGLSIAAMKRANELATMSAAELDAGLDRIWAAMDGCIERGCSTGGVLPGELQVRRRAAGIYDQLAASWARNDLGPLAANDWLSVYAMAVNEENAAGGRVVTAPTNGASGVMPAVLKYFLKFEPRASREVIREMLLTAAAIAGIVKTNASISGAEVGCQGEVGAASAMAAAALCAALGGTPTQIENAAEIALEHHLGMTCDPVGGLVQIPCIERNAFGAVKAVTAASLALKGDGAHAVPLDTCIETMRQTGADMSERYKETSLAGLALNVTAC
ncbi:MAG: L-serine ammonia-lyase [Hyphomicrobiales bacterium]|nr:MAG: L-serine ammonia-lyase [Hyphomicrobiales bacterium]